MIFQSEIKWCTVFWSCGGQHSPSLMLGGLGSVGEKQSCSRLIWPTQSEEWVQTKVQTKEIQTTHWTMEGRADIESILHMYTSQHLQSKQLLTWTDPRPPAGGAATLKVDDSSSHGQEGDGVRTQTSLEGPQPASPPRLMRRHGNTTHISQYKNRFKATLKHSHAAPASLTHTNLHLSHFNLQDESSRQRLSTRISITPQLQPRQHHSTHEAPSKSAF